MVLYNQLTLHSVLNGQEDLCTLKLRAAVASLKSEQKDNTNCFLEFSAEEIAGLPNGQGIQVMVNVCIFLKYSSIIEPKAKTVCLVELHTIMRAR